MPEKFEVKDLGCMAIKNPILSPCGSSRVGKPINYLSLCCVLNLILRLILNQRNANAFLSPEASAWQPVSAPYPLPGADFSTEFGDSVSAAPILAPAGKRPVRLLIVDDCIQDAILMAAALERGNYSPTFDHVDTPEAFRSRLANGNYDAILCDHNLHTWRAKDALEILHSMAKEIPFVVVTGTLGDERAVQYLKDGASDYVLKDGLERLPSAIDRALRDKSQRDEHARLQNAIWKAKKDWERTFDAIPDSIMLLDTEHRVLRANRATADLLGLPFSQLIGQHCFALVHHSSAPVSNCPFQKMRASNSKQEDEFLEPKLNRIMRVITIPFRNGHDGYGAIHVMQDVTERRRLEEALIQAQKLEAVGRLAGGVAHDFNNILCVIQGYSELLQSEMAKDEKSAGQIQAILGAVQRAQRVTSQLLAFSRKQVLQPQVLNLNDVITGLRELLSRLIPENIRLIVSPDANLSLVKADRVQVEQVLMNLVVNARDAMPKGGEIVITTSNTDVDSQRADGFQGELATGRYASIAVHDNGIGMDQETLSHVFEPFYTTKEKGKGTGLGLAIVYGIVKQSGGYISVKSQPTQGSTFTIYLPPTAEQKELLRMKAPPRTMLDKNRTETILVVEDELNITTVVSTVLESAGYTVLKAATAQEALDSAAAYAGRIDLMLTDVGLPGDMDGTELADVLRRLRPETKILFMSGYSDSLNGHSQQPNQCALLQKPFSVAELQSKVREELSSPSSQRGAALAKAIGDS